MGYTEIFMYSNSLFYSYLKKQPFTAWGETCVLVLNTMGIAVLIWKHQTKPIVGPVHKAMAVVALIAYVVFVNVVLPPRYYHLLLTFNSPLTVLARGNLIYTIYKCRHTGANSLISNIMNLVGSLIRILTTIGEVGWDRPLLMTYGTSAVCNSILVSQFFIYKKGTEAYLESLKVKKKKE